MMLPQDEFDKLTDNEKNCYAKGYIDGLEHVKRLATATTEQLEEYVRIHGPEYGEGTVEKELKYRYKKTPWWRFW